MLGPLSPYIPWLFSGLFILVWKLGRPLFRRPPGPRPWPIIGNAFDLPTTNSWLTYNAWSKTYGMLSASLFNLSILTISRFRSYLSECPRKMCCGAQLLQSGNRPSGEEVPDLFRSSMWYHGSSVCARYHPTNFRRPNLSMLKVGFRIQPRRHALCSILACSSTNAEPTFSSIRFEKI